MDAGSARRPNQWRVQRIEVDFESGPFAPEDALHVVGVDVAAAHDQLLQGPERLVEKASVFNVLFSPAFQAETRVYVFSNFKFPDYKFPEDIFRNYKFRITNF
jgi:hypothetical protein